MIREYLESFENFETIGRNGLHRYNNQDHAMLTGMLAVRNMVLGENNDLWVVNAEQEYLEEITEIELKPEEIEAAVDSAIAHAFMKVDSGALGMALGTATGLALFITTLLVYFAGWPEVVGKLFLLGQYLPGYGVTIPGSIFGLVFGFLIGFLVGWWVAFMRNAMVLLYLRITYRRAQVQMMRKLLDF
jgi:hypothetical protein